MKLSPRDELDLRAYVKNLVSGLFPRQLDAFFTGTILTTQSINLDGAGPFICTIARQGEARSDGNTYLCANPGYWPQIGDLVECMWRDRATAYVLWPTSTPASPGTLGYAQVTANQAAITAEVDLTGLAATVYVGSGRRIRASWQMIALSTIDADVIALQLKDTYQGVTTVVGQDWMVSKGVSLNQTLSGKQPLKPAKGEHAYKLTLQRNAGTGNVTMAANATTPAYLHIEDVGI